VATMFMIAASVAEFAYIPMTWNNTSHFTTRLVLLLVILASTAGPTVYIAMVDGKGNSDNIPLIVGIVQFFTSVVATIAFAIIPSGCMFGDRAVGKPRKYTASQTSTTSYPALPGAPAWDPSFFGRKEVFLRQPENTVWDSVSFMSSRESNKSPPKDASGSPSRRRDLDHTRTSVPVSCGLNGFAMSTRSIYPFVEYLSALLEYLYTQFRFPNNNMQTSDIETAQFLDPTATQRFGNHRNALLISSYAAISSVDLPPCSYLPQPEDRP
jgi:hypothetical protein